jgi:hypothetical protein
MQTTLTRRGYIDKMYVENPEKIHVGSETMCKVVSGSFNSFRIHNTAFQKVFTFKAEP